MRAKRARQLRKITKSRAQYKALKSLWRDGKIKK